MVLNRYESSNLQCIDRIVPERDFGCSARYSRPRADAAGLHPFVPPELKVSPPGRSDTYFKKTFRTTVQRIIVR
jgi:hypothetical protein